MTTLFLFLNLINTGLAPNSAQALSYKHQVSIDIHIPTITSISPSQVFKEFDLAQTIWRQCGINIQIRNLIRSQLRSDIALDFETLAFNNWRISLFEHIVFNTYYWNSPVIHYVEYLDWSYDKNGTRAISYPLFLHSDLKKIHAGDLNFYLDKMVGSAIVSSLRDKSTLAHELGHSLFNLKHSNSPRNLMIGSVLGERKHFQITDKQCTAAREHLSSSL